MASVMNIRICDLCSDKHPKHQIKLTHRPNDEDLIAELCDQCVYDIVKATEPTVTVYHGG